MDQIDTKIIQILKINARIRNVEIAKEIELTEGAVRNRIDRLLKNGIITCFTIDVATGSTLSAIVMIKAKDETKKMMQALASSQITKEAYEISGDFDGCAIIEGETLEELDEKVDKIRKIASVAETKTFVSFRKWE